MKRKRGWEGVKKRKDRGFRMRKEDRRNGRKGEREKGSDKLFKQRDVQGPREVEREEKVNKITFTPAGNSLHHTPEKS